jgi:hypothetical protein
VRRLFRRVPIQVTQDYRPTLPFRKPIDLVIDDRLRFIAEHIRRGNEIRSRSSAIAFGSLVAVVTRPHCDSPRDPVQPTRQRCPRTDRAGLFR